MRGCEEGFLVPGSGCPTSRDILSPPSARKRNRRGAEHATAGALLNEGDNPEMLALPIPRERHLRPRRQVGRRACATDDAQLADDGGVCEKAAFVLTASDLGFGEGLSPAACRRMDEALRYIRRQIATSAGGSLQRS